MSSSSSNIRKGFPCNCPDLSVLRISQTRENPGRKFWTCPNYKVPLLLISCLLVDFVVYSCLICEIYHKLQKNGGCGFFRWACEEEDCRVDELGKKSNYSRSKKSDCDEVGKSKTSQSQSVLNQSEIRVIKSLLEGIVGLLVVISVLVLVIVIKM
jgi:hypothetical protein